LQDNYRAFDIHGFRKVLARRFCFCGTIFVLQFEVPEISSPACSEGAGATNAGLHFFRGEVSNLPSRILRDGIIDSERVNRLSPRAELFYRRLLSKVDDYGRIEFQPRVLLAKCFPLQLDRVSMADIDDWAREIETSFDPIIDDDPLLFSYIVGSKKYLQINNFQQRIRGRSKCPEPPPPSVDRTPPSVDRTPPSVDRTPPSVDRTPPSVDRTPPSVDRTPPPSARASTSHTPSATHTSSHSSSHSNSINGSSSDKKNKISERSELQEIQDNRWFEFRQAFTQTGRELIESDFDTKHHTASCFCAKCLWLKLDLAEQLACVKGIRRDIEKQKFSGPEFWPKPKTYLSKREWERKPQTRKKGRDVMEGVFNA
jgi:hypothetical protein